MALAGGIVRRFILPLYRHFLALTLNPSPKGRGTNPVLLLLREKGLGDEGLANCSAKSIAPLRHKGGWGDLPSLKERPRFLRAIAMTTGEAP